MTNALSTAATRRPVCHRVIGLLSLALSLGLSAVTGAVAEQAPLAAPGVLSVPVRDQGARHTGTARIRGRIVAADSGQPLRRVTVRASAPELRESVSSTTGPDGSYELGNLPAGRYTITASKSAYVTRSYGQARGADGGRAVEVRDNQAIDRIDLRLPRGGAITGTILDEFGEPVPDAQVVALRQQYVGGRRRLVPAGRTATTNDVGAYRLFGLAPGSYFVSVSPGGAPVLEDVQEDDQTDYASTYYPGTPDIAGAHALTVNAGQTLTGITLSLVATQTASVSGTVVDVFGNRAHAGGVTAIPRGGVTLIAQSGVGMVAPDGSFTISGLSPGDYILSAMTAPDANGADAPALAFVSVNGQHLTGIELRPVPPAVVRGSVTLDAGAVQSLRSPVQLDFVPVDGEEISLLATSFAPAVTLADDLTFETRVAFGRLAVRLSSPDNRWSLKAVRYQGIDVTDSGFEIAPGQDLSGLEVELTSRKQDVSGVVTNAGRPVTSYVAILFPQDPELRQGLSRHIAVGSPDQEGRFRVRTLPAGDYYAVAVPSVEEGAWLDPEFLDSLSHAAVSLSLHEGETARVDLRLAAAR